MLRIDLEKSVHNSELDLATLSPFQRILLTTDGTVTEILEAQFWEPIELVKLFQDNRKSDHAIPYLNCKINTALMIRKILLRGENSKTNFIYAESIIVPDHLDDDLQHGLQNTNQPLGRLMIDAKTETFREILSCQYETAKELAGYFQLNENDQLISRTYRIYAKKRPIMLITEKFPETSFL